MDGPTTSELPHLPICKTYQKTLTQERARSLTPSLTFNFHETIPPNRMPPRYRPAPPGPAPPLPVLTFAALSWVSDGPGHYDNPTLEELSHVLGVYELAIPGMPFDLLNVRRRDPAAPFVYVPRRGRGLPSATFTYERKASTNHACTCHPTGWGPFGAEEVQGPRFALVAPDKDPLPYRLPKGLYDQTVVSVCFFFFLFSRHPLSFLAIRVVP